MLTSHALASRLRSKRHDNAKEGSQTCPALHRSIEPLNTCLKSRVIDEGPADTVGEYTLHAVMDLRLRTTRISGPARNALTSKPTRPPAPLHAMVMRCLSRCCTCQSTRILPVASPHRRTNGKSPIRHSSSRRTKTNSIPHRCRIGK